MRRHRTWRHQSCRSGHRGVDGRCGRRPEAEFQEDIRLVISNGEIFMPRVSAAFFMTGALFLIMGMCWGIAMAVSQNFALAPAHAHLNLLGWVTMSIYGTFYAL